MEAKKEDPSSFASRSSENASRQFSVVRVATGDVKENDVLLGRGKKIQYNTGNILYLQLIFERLPGNIENAQQPPASRHSMADVIISIVVKRGGRFLKPVDSSDGDFWETVDPRRVVAKVRQALRDAEAKRCASTSRKTVAGTQRGIAQSQSLGNPSRKQKQQAPAMDPPSDQLRTSTASIVSSLAALQETAELARWMENQRRLRALSAWVEDKQRIDATLTLLQQQQQWHIMTSDPLWRRQQQQLASQLLLHRQGGVLRNGESGSVTQLPQSFPPHDDEVRHYY